MSTVPSLLAAGGIQFGHPGYAAGQHHQNIFTHTVIHPCISLYGNCVVLLNAVGGVQRDHPGYAAGQHHQDPGIYTVSKSVGNPSHCCDTDCPGRNHGALRSSSSTGQVST